MSQTGGCIHLLVGGVQASIADVLLHRLRKEEGLLQHDPQLSPQAVPGHSPDIHPIDADGPLVQVVEAGEEIHQGGLSGAGGSDQGDALAGSGAEVHPLQHRNVRDVGEGNVLEGHVSLNPGHFPGARRVGLIRGRVQDLEDPLRSRQGPLDLGVEIPQLPEGLCKTTRVGYEGGDGADGDHSVDGHPTAQPTQDGHVGVGEDPHQGHDQEGQRHGLNSRGPNGLVGLVKVGQHTLLLAVRQDHPLPAVRFLQDPVQDAQLRLVAPEGTPGPFSYRRHQADHDGEDDHGSQGEPDIHGEHDGQDPHQGQESGEELDHVVRDDPADGVHVVRQPAHEVPLSPGIEEPKGEGLHVPEEVSPERPHGTLG